MWSGDHLILIVMKTQGALAMVLIGLIATSLLLCGGNSSHQFKSFKARYGRVYTSNEEKFRRSILDSNIKKIAEHNSDSSNTYQMGVTEFADMTTEEFVSKILMKELPTSTVDRISFDGPVANGVDWRNQGAVSGVKNQGSCGSCWSFSTTGALESAYKIKHGNFNLLSEQQLVDCCGAKGFQCQGCNGAWPEWALNYINSVGIVGQASYPYTGRVGSCSVTGGSKILAASPYKMITAGDIGTLKSAVGTEPISVCLDASNWSLYKSGVFSNCAKVLNHAVLLVGYEDSGNWIVKNSWGTTWGESGFIRLATGNTCGIADHAILVNVI